MWFLFLLFFSGIFSEELEVELATERGGEVYPIYFSICSNGSGLSSTYLESLYKIVENDLKLTGCFYLIPKKEECEKTISSLDVKTAFNKIFWRRVGACYLAKLLINNNKKISTQLDCVNDEKYKKLTDVELTGNLNLDRKKIHYICDMIVNSFFGRRGISRSSLIYSVKEPHENGWKSEIWMSDVDGANCLQITKFGGYCVTPTFFPQNRNLFLYVSYKGGQPKIYVYSLKERKSFPDPFITLRGNQFGPSFSAKGDKLVFISDAAGRPDIFIQELDKSGRSIGMPYQIFSAIRATQSSPKFSPDGEKLAFVSDKDGSPRIYVIKVPKEQANNSSIRKRPYANLITKANRQNVSPSWSSDGTKLAYSAKNEGERQLWIYDFERDEEWQLTSGPGNKENPEWADDGFHIIFNTEDKNVGELYLIDINKKEAVKITNGNGKKRFPSWVPNH